jgi:multisubunit Na+/H+ antiporter MnhB subunit
MNSYQFTLLVVAVSIILISLALFYLRPRVKMRRDLRASKLLNLLIIGALLLLIVGIVMILVPPKFWWPAY